MKKKVYKRMKIMALTMVMLAGLLSALILQPTYLAYAKGELESSQADTAENIIKNAVFDTSVNWDGYEKVGPYTERLGDGTLAAIFNGDGSANIKPSTKGSQGLVTKRWLRQTFKTIPGVYYTVNSVTEHVDISFSDGAYSIKGPTVAISTETKDGQSVFKAQSDQTTITLTAQRYGTGITSARISELNIQPFVMEGNMIKNANFDTSTYWDGYYKVGGYNERKGDGTLAATFNGNGLVEIKPSTKGSQGLITNRWLRQSFKTVPGVYYTIESVTKNVDVTFSDGVYSLSNHGTNIPIETKDGVRVFKAKSDQTTITLTAKRYGLNVSPAYVAGMSVTPFAVSGNIVQNAAFHTSANWDGYYKVGGYSERKDIGDQVATFNGDGSVNIKPNTKGSQGLITRHWLRQTLKTVPGLYYKLDIGTNYVDATFSDGAYTTKDHGTVIPIEKVNGEQLFQATSDQTTITLTTQKYGTNIPYGSAWGISVTLVKVDNITINPIKATDNYVTGTAAPGAVLELFDVTNGKQMQISDKIVTSQDGTFKFNLTKELSGGTNVMVRAFYDHNSTDYRVVTGLGQIQIENMDKPTWIYKTGVTKGKFHDRQALGFILPSNSSLKVRQINPNYTGSLTIRLIGSGRSLDEQTTIGKEWKTIRSTDHNLVPFISTPYAKGAILEYEIEEGVSLTPLPTILKGTNKEAFFNEWDKVGAEFILLKSKSIQMLVNSRDKASFKAMNSFNGSIDSYIDYLEDIFSAYNKYLGLDGSSHYNENGNNRYLILNNSGGKNPTYGVNFINRPGLSKFFTEKNWGILHEIGHGYQASYGNGYFNGLREVSNNIFASLFLYDRYGKGALGNMDKQDSHLYQHYIVNNGNFKSSPYKLEQLMFMIQKAGENSFIKMNQAYRQLANEPGFRATNYPLENLINKYYSENSHFDFSPYLQRVGAPIIEEQAASNRANNYKGLAVLADIVPENQLAKARALVDPKATFVNSDFALVTNNDISALGLKGDIEIQLTSDDASALSGKTLQIKDGNDVVQEQVIGDTGKVTFTNIANGVYNIDIKDFNAVFNHDYVYVKEAKNTNEIIVNKVS